MEEGDARAEEGDEKAERRRWRRRAEAAMAEGNTARAQWNGKQGSALWLIWEG